MKTNIFEQFVVTVTPELLVEYGKWRGWHFHIMEEKGVLSGKVEKYDATLKSHWVFEPDSNTNLTSEKEKAYKMLDEVWKAGFPIKQVIYGFQVKPEKKPIEFPKPSPETVETAKKVAIGGLGLLLGAAALVGYGFLMALSADPALIVVLDDGKDSWVCLHSWDE